MVAMSRPPRTDHECEPITSWLAVNAAPCGSRRLAGQPAAIVRSWAASASQTPARCVAAAAKRDVQPFLSCKREGLRDVLGHPTTHHHARTHAVKASDLQPARRLVLGRARAKPVSADPHRLDHLFNIVAASHEAPAAGR